VASTIHSLAKQYIGSSNDASKTSVDNCCYADGVSENLQATNPE